MTTSTTLRRHGVYLAVVPVLSAAAFAQTAILPAGTDPKKGSEIIELSPFTVSASAETGYVATSSLVGSRVNTKLKDIASQIDVMTPEFLQDIGADSIADAVLYSSNFGGAADQTGGANGGLTGSLEARARGQDAATISTDFFATNLPIDFYNIDRLNLAYGAQSVLFGLGNAGGVLDSSTKCAQMRNLSSVDTKFDNWGSTRVVLDFNQQLIPKVLAVRLVGLDADSHQFTEGGHKKSLRGFGAFTLQVTPATTIRGSYEKVDVKVQQAGAFLPVDYSSPWIYAGRPLFDNSKGNASITATNPLLNKNNNALRVMSYGAGAASYIPWTGSAVTKGPEELPGVTDQPAMSLIDNTIYPLDRDPRVSSRQNNITGNQVRFSIEHKINQDLYFEFAFNYEKRDEQGGGNFDNGESLNIRIDPNMYLPGGTAAKPSTALNPNRGKLYIESYPNGTINFDSTQEARLTGFYEFDSAKRLRSGLSWLGRYRLATLLSTRLDRNESQNDRAMVVGDTSFTTGDKLNNSRLLRVRYYLDSPSDANSTGNYTATVTPGTGVFGPWTLTDPTTNTPVTYAMFNNPDGRNSLPVGSKVKVSTAMVALQSFFWKDRLNFFVGLRQDHVKSYSFDSVSNTRLDQVTAGDQKGLYRNLTDATYNEVPDAVKTVVLHTYGVVFHPLPWATLFYNTSQNTALPPAKFGPFGNPLLGTDSDGYDYGIRFDLLQDRLSVRLNFYEDNQKNFWSNPFNELRNFSRDIEVRLRGDDKPAGIGPVAASTFDPIAIPVGSYRSLSAKTAKGLDLVVVANLTPNWTMRATVGNVDNQLQGRGVEWIDWINQRLPVWQDAGGLGWDNVSISSTDATTIHQYYDKNIVPQVTTQQLVLGNIRQRQRDWRANVFTNYRFTQERLKGLSLGGGIRWASPAKTGNAGRIVPGLAAPIDDSSINYWNTSQTFCDLVAGYKRKYRLFGHSATINLQLNVRNALNKDGLEAVSANHAGVNYEYARITPRQFVFSAGLDF